MSVALRKESVDRNQVCIVTGRLLQVALRKESVDRNYYADKSCDWVRVALRKESVDRNFCVKLLLLLMMCRSPQGERG